ncbi:MAG TPA: TonB-dependent receptor [Thermoanaerobaculia bacterium]|nr:TonB-dependent receptor [Thermoanaerobaculia bacterium]
MFLESLIKRASILAVLLLSLASSTLAQVQSGNIYGTVLSSNDKSPLPGVTVTLTGVGAPLTQATDAQGKFRFLGLSPGAYTIKSEIEGFSPLEKPDVTVNIGRNTSLEILQPMAATDVINVTADALLDRLKQGPGQTITLKDLESTPTARDPWAVLASTPGVVADRINVGGNESGQQALFVGPGSTCDQAVWSMDGMVITDMAALGGSPTYFDFDAFEEMQVSTGGTDTSVATGGVVLNMVTKRGTNEVRGSARYLVDDKGTQGNLSLSKSDLGQPGPWNGNTPQTSFTQGNRIDRNAEEGVEIGGPILKDKLWFWGSYSKQDIDLFTIDDFSDKTTLKDWNGKLNAQLTPANSTTLFAFNGDKIKTGRNAGPLRPQETTWDQSNFGPSPTGYKAEDTQIFGQDFYLTGMYSVVNGGFQLVPEGGNALPFLDANLVWHNSYFLNQLERPQKQGKLDASNFFNLGGTSNELKYGASYRTAQQSSLFNWEGGGLNIASDPENLLVLVREANSKIETDYTSAYLQDTLSSGNLTANFGLRYDRQTGKNLASTAAANPIFPDLLPATHYDGQDAGFTWNTLAPRLGLTYAVGAEKKTLLRASYSRFADQLGIGTAGFLNPLATASYRYFYTTNPGSPTLSPGDVGQDLGASPNVNPFTFQPLQSSAVNPNLSAPITDELLFGVEHALLPDFVVGLNLTYRKTHDIIDAERLVFDGDANSPEALSSVGRPARPDDYVQAAPVTVIAPDGHTYTVRYYELRPGVTTRNGFYLTNGDREQEYKGAALTFDKRLSNRWMLRGNVSYSDWKWRIPSSENQDPTDNIGGGVVDGTDVLQASGTTSGPKGNVFIDSKWSYNLNTLYQVAPDHPWGFNLAANLTGRQGYPLRYAVQINRQTINDGPNGIDVPVDASADTFRYPDVHVVNLRVEKEFNLRNVGLNLGLDVFNAFNEAYVLQDQSILGRSNSANVVEVLSPRIFRLGARISLR